MKKIALVFPGQGSQKIGMMDQLAADFPQVLTYFAQASELLGYDLWQIVTQDPEEQLNQTIYTQPAMLVADYAFWQILQQTTHDLNPAYLAGHSLGEYAALVAADVITFSEAVALVAKRAQFMQECVRPGDGAMAAILGLDVPAVESICQQASSEVMLANLNCPGQLVIAGSNLGVEAAIKLAKEAGAKAIKLPMSVPSHCYLMRPAAEKLSQELDKVTFKSPRLPVINNVDVAILTEPLAIKSALTRQLFSPVRWIETIEYMLQNGVTQIIECGPGKVLTNMNKRIHPEMELLTSHEFLTLKTQ